VSRSLWGRSLWGRGLRESGHRIGGGKEGVGGVSTILKEDGAALLLETGDPVVQGDWQLSSLLDALMGDEEIAIVQGGETRRVSAAAVRDYING